MTAVLAPLGLAALAIAFGFVVAVMLGGIAP